jgi:hypothetical protein
MVYAEESDTVLLKFGVASPATYNVALYDPRSGSYTNLADYTGSGPVTLTPPDTQDWIFIVTAKTDAGQPLPRWSELPRKNP